METSTDTPDNTHTPHTPDPLDVVRWARAVDRALWHDRARALAADGIRPREARLLRALASEQAAELLTRLRQHPHGGKGLRRLAERGWIAETDGTWSLTDAGRDAADGLRRQAEQFDARLHEAASAEELAAAGATLDAVARALGAEGDPGEAHHPRHRGGFGPRGHRFGPHRDRSPRHRGAEGAEGAERAYERGFAAGFTEGRTAARA
ncbi:hypothetical protein DEU37_0139 [Microbacterium sp. AG790]|uniref:hypothetical protein n=1 Tax=Microbacterium sp. AG790 TaxID=2183995 RepID=UPI000EAF5A90|nr:hypothetical protein [Microbacterium sp. AG790]RKS92749.1 hypothetical protein DEU37_0139 [Microbacterium sp. AG790]